jgi:hypothetical protein
MSLDHYFIPWERAGPLVADIVVHLQCYRLCRHFYLLVQPTRIFERRRRTAFLLAKKEKGASS